MKTRLSLSLMLAFLLLQTIGQTQQNSRSKVYLIQQMESYRGATSTVDQFFSNHADQFQLAADSEMKKESSSPGINGMVHHRYRQFHQGIPVFGATYLLHEKDGQVNSANGYFRPQIDLAPQASISPEEALHLAQQDMKAKKYAWEINFSNAAFDYQKPQPQLCYVDPRFPHRSENVVLAYQFELHSWEPFDKQLYFVDAHTGYIHQKIPLLHESGVPAKAQTKYYGEQDIIVDSIGIFEYHLHDDTRGDGISTFNFDLTVFTNNSTNWDLINADQDEVALDAHYCSEKFYDLLQDQYQWDGIDNNGESMNAVVHANQGNDFVNAFWDGALAWFGNGDCNNGPLTTLEVVGHEFTHGIIQRTSNLTYASESGAINEHFADVMGKLLEHLEDPNNFSWTLGKSFQYDPSLPPFRSMEDPASLNMPDFYKGSIWNDASGVHTNSSVGNHFYYLMSEGESGINELGDAYDVPAIGIEKAAAIIFHTNRHYLTESSDYPAYHTLSLTAAEELFGSGSTEVEAVREAWKAVGLPYSGGVPDKIDLSVEIDPALRVQNTCLLDEYTDLVYSISNLGTETYFPEAGDELEINITGSIQMVLMIPLEDTLLAGESKEYIISDVIYLTITEQIFSIFNLTVSQDENIFNNNAFSFIRNFIHSDNEISIFANGGKFNCLDRNYELEIFLSNQSCNDLPSGTNLTISLNDITGVEVWTRDVETPYPIIPSNSYILQETIELSNWVSGNYFLQVELAGDPVTSNNQSQVFLAEPKEITEDYLNDFNSDNTYLDKMNADSYLFPHLTTYNGEQYFVTTQRLSSPFQDLCFLEEGNFNGDFGDFNLITGFVEGCLDLSNELQPFVDFDLVQFRSDNDPEPTEQSSMVQVAWNGSESGSQIIYGQAEGEVVHHSFSLPPNFKGEYSFKFLNRRGGETDPADPIFYKQDVNLIDNIHFYSTTVSTANPVQERLKLYPNPVTNQLYIEQSFDIKKLQIVNTQGQVLLTKVAYDGLPIDLSNLADGYYWLASWDQEDDKVITPFVKLMK